MSRPSRAPTSSAPSSRPGKERSMVRGELAVAISSTYRAYHPGRRRLAPITLLPKHDTTAYIYDEYKTLPNSKDSRVHINYLVGWTDLQAGMISVDAGRIHEYVSARAYEDWNTKRATERDEELRKEEEAENVKLVEEAEMKERGMNLRNGTFQVPARSTSRDHAESSTALKDKRRKASRHIHQRASPVSRDSAPTILAPTESSRDMKADGRPDSACDTDASIRRQLEGDDTTGESESLTYSPPAISTVSMMGIGMSSGSEPGLKRRRTSSLSHSQQQDPWRELDAGRAGGSTARSSAMRQDLQYPPVSASGQSSSTDSPTNHTTAFNRQTQGMSSRSVSQSPKSLHEAVGDTQTDEAMGPQPVASLSSTQVSSAVARPPTSTTQSTTPLTGFTPLGGRRSSPWTRMINSPSVTNYQSSVRLPINSKPIVMESPAASSAEPPTKDSKKATLKPPVPPAEPEDESGEVYEVKRLEDTKLHDTENGVQRMFLVRWKGSWPEGQNPTWEPEENIPQDLARKFMLKRKAEIGKNKATDTARRTASPPWKQQRKWSSVSEAFAGDDNGPDFGKTGKIKSKVREAMGPDGDEQLLVVDEQTPTSKPALNWDMLMGSKFGGTA
ncbi:chromo domain-containing protein [Verticillium dahliae]|nr:Exportin-1 [Verticillium dahliae VDG2]